jgi:hypothetical protein
MTLRLTDALIRPPTRQMTASLGSIIHDAVGNELGFAAGDEAPAAGP